METDDFILKLLFLSVILLCGTAVWYAVASWWKYRFSAWWLLVVALLPLALLMFPLYSHLRYERAKKLGRPGEEVERNLLYKRMSWALIVCYAVAGGIAHAILKVALPGYGYVGELQFVLTTLSLAIASAGCLWSVGR